MTKRSKTPIEIETEILTKSARRCCICFGLQSDLSQKRGQIAHLDGNCANVDQENLAFLCMSHHDEYDGVTSQSKGLTISEVKAYRTLLYEAIHQIRDINYATQNMPINNSRESDYSSEINLLLSKLLSRSIPLSECFVQALAISQKLKSTKLEMFCRNELSGYNNTKPPESRIIETFVSGDSQININCVLWEQNVDKIFEYMQHETESFKRVKMLLPYPLNDIESSLQKTDSSKSISEFKLKYKDLNPNAQNPDAVIFGYARSSDIHRALEQIRKELTVLLLDALPKPIDEDKK
jgi:hypothetical protein